MNYVVLISYPTAFEFQVLLTDHSYLVRWKEVSVLSPQPSTPFPPFRFFLGVVWQLGMCGKLRTFSFFLREVNSQRAKGK